MDNLFTININPDENVRLNTNTEKNQFGNFRGDREGLTVPPDEEQNKNNGSKGSNGSNGNTNDNNNNHYSVEEDEVITLEMDQISTSDSFDMLEELNENQINDYENMRKKIRVHILTSFQKDNILIEGPEQLEPDCFMEPNLEGNENILVKLRKDKIYRIVSSASQERNKRSRPNEANNRYYYDPNVLGEDAPGDYDNFVDVLLGRKAPRRGASPPSKGEGNATVEGGEEDAAVEGGEENATIEEGEENATVEGGDENATIEEGDENAAAEVGEENATVEEGEEIAAVEGGDENDATAADVENTGTAEIEGKPMQAEDISPVAMENAERCTQTGEEICTDDSKSNQVVDDFREKIKNWLVKFPDINAENLFFHFYFQSELYKEKKYTCQNCGSSDCDRELTFRHVCKNTYCFLCYKRVTGPICHNTKAQYMAFKANAEKLLNDLKYIQHPYGSMPCLNCFSNDHLKCGRPPYIYAKHSHNVRREYNSKLDPSYYVYMRNPRNIWILHEPKSGERRGNDDGDNNALRNGHNRSGQSSSSGGNGGNNGGNNGGGYGRGYGGGNGGGYGRGYGRGGEHGNRRDNRRGSDTSQAAANQERVGAAPHNRHKDARNFSSNHNVYMEEDDDAYDNSKRKVILTKNSFNDNAQRNKQKRNYDAYDSASQNNFHSNNKRHKNDAHQSGSYHDYKNKQQVGNDQHDNISDFHPHGGKHGNRNRGSDQFSSRHHNKNRNTHDSGVGDYYNNDGRGQDNRNSGGNHPGGNHPGGYYNMHNEANDGAQGYTNGQMNSARSGLYKFASATSGHFNNPKGSSSMKQNANFHVNKNNSHNMHNRHQNNNHSDDNPKRGQGKGNHGGYSSHNSNVARQNSNVARHKQNNHSGNGPANNKGGNTLYKNTHKNVHPDRGAYHNYR
ncbi:conserved Plasmodium protein, unknown function [Plasmodium vivax]|uniref:Uncharacterized protein n=1 Tax=Plasmodium vivax TaxID=5855 RepID=A0A1G4H250_PLAVI|nr:conserved Plasmodium protein, unknown function [Plasmodium vivax]